MEFIRGGDGGLRLKREDMMQSNFNWLPSYATMKAKILPIIVRGLSDEERRLRDTIFYRWTQFLPPVKVQSIDDWLKLPEMVGDADALLFFGGYWGEIKPLQQVEKPIFIWSWTNGESLSMWELELLHWLKANNIKVISAISGDRLRVYLRALATARSLKGGKIGLFLAQKEMPFIWGIEKVKKNVQRLGLKIEELSRKVVEDALKESSDREVEEIVEKMRIKFEGVSKAYIKESYRLYLALKRVIEKKKYLGATVDCLMRSFYGENGIPVHPCLAFSLLNDEGVACSCEGDYITAITMAILSRFLGEPCFMTNIYPLPMWPAVAEHLGVEMPPYEPGKHAILCHCAFLGVVPPSISKQMKLVKKEDKTHRDGVMVDAEIDAGPITIVKLSPTFTSIQAFGGYLKNIYRFSALHCRAGGIVKVEDAAKIAERLYSHHVVVVKNDRREEIKTLAEMMNLSYEEI